MDVKIICLLKFYLELFQPEEQVTLATWLLLMFQIVLVPVLTLLQAPHSSGIRQGFGIIIISHVLL